jgi:hypothetical protein
MSDPDRDALIEEIDSRLLDVLGSNGICAGHGAICRGLATLLRCQRAQLRQRNRAWAWGSGAGAIAGGLATAIMEYFRTH